MASRPRTATPVAEEDLVVVTAVVPYGEADAVVRLLARGRGRVAAFARGALRSRRRFPGLSAPALGRAAIAPRARAELLELRELDLDPALLPLAVELRALAHAAYLAELVERLLPEAEPAPEIFDLVSSAMRRLAEAGPSSRLLRAVELKLLFHLGYLPDLSDPAVDVASGVELPEDARLAALALVQAPNLEALPDVPDALLRPVSRLFAAHLRRQGGGPLKSVQFLASLDATSVAGPDRSR